MINGKFVVNSADHSPLTIYGVGTFLAFSGNGVYRNKSGCGGIPKLGPIPAGRYWIVDRPSGGLGSRAITAAKDIFNSLKYRRIALHSDWFALYRDDGTIDDLTWINGVERGHFRLHPGTIS